MTPRPVTMKDYRKIVRAKGLEMIMEYLKTIPGCTEDRGDIGHLTPAELLKNPPPGLRVGMPFIAINPKTKKEAK